jgi:hypothetical protein
MSAWRPKVVIAGFVVFVSAAVAVEVWLTSRHAAEPGSLAFTGVSILESTGRVTPGMTVVVTRGRIASVEPTEERLIPGATAYDSRGKLLVAVTLDPAEPVILDGFRHAWAGQLRPGDPGDVFILNTFDPRRFRSEDVTDANVVAAVVGGKYYSHNMLLAQREQPGGR